MSRKRELEVPPTQQMMEDDVEDSSSSSGDYEPPTPPLAPEEAPSEQVPGTVPDLAAFFAQHPYFSDAQIVKLCRGFAAFNAYPLSTAPSAGEKKKVRWPWSREPEAADSPAQSQSFSHPRRVSATTVAAPPEKKKKRYWEK